MRARELNLEDDDDGELQEIRQQYAESRLTIQQHEQALEQQLQKSVTDSSVPGDTEVVRQTLNVYAQRTAIDAALKEHLREAGITNFVNLDMTEADVINMEALSTLSNNKQQAIKKRAELEQLRENLKLIREVEEQSLLVLHAYEKIRDGEQVINYLLFNILLLLLLIFIYNFFI